MVSKVRIYIPTLCVIHKPIHYYVSTIYHVLSARSVYKTTTKYIRVPLHVGTPGEDLAIKKYTFYIIYRIDIVCVCVCILYTFNIF